MPHALEAPLADRAPITSHRQSRAQRDASIVIIPKSGLRAIGRCPRSGRPSTSSHSFRHEGTGAGAWRWAAIKVLTSLSTLTLL